MAVENKKAMIFLLVILAIAAFFRLWQLDSIPPGLYPDVAINGNDALDSLKTGQFKVFYPENNGREGLFIWLIALSFSIFGPSIWTIKIVPAIIGILTVFGLYLLTKELFSRKIGLLASFFLAISFWHVNFSRIGFRAIMVPFILVFAFYFLFKGFRIEKRFNPRGCRGLTSGVKPFIISGIFFGLGFYTYISYRFVIFLLGPILILRKKYFRFTIYCLLFTVLVALPIGIYFLLNPGDFFGRAAGVSILASQNPVYELGKSLILHLGMFNVYGDGNWRHNLSGSPELLWPVGIFFLIGFIYSIVKKYWFLISWFFIFLLPGILSYEGIPHSLRVIGTMPAVFIFAGLGACLVFEQLKKFSKTKKQVFAFYLCIFIFLATLVYAEFDKYFEQWAKKPEVADVFSKNYVELGNYLNSLPDNVLKYVIVNQPGVPVPFPNGIPMPAQTPMFIERVKYGKIRTTYLLPEDLDKIKIEEEAVVIPIQK